MFRSLRARWQLNGLIRDWVSFREDLLASPEAAPLTPQAEKRSLGRRARIATRIQGLADRIPPRMVPEARKNIVAMTDLLQPAGWPDRQEREGLWQQQFIFLNKLKGAGLATNGAATESDQAAVPTGFRKPKQSTRHFSLLGPLRFLLGVGVLCVVIYALGVAFGVHRDAGGNFVVDKSGGIGKAVQNGLNGLGSFWHQAVDFLSPVLSTYGPSWTIVLVGLLLISVTYWFLARG